MSCGGCRCRCIRVATKADLPDPCTTPCLSVCQQAVLDNGQIWEIVPVPITDLNPCGQDWMLVGPASMIPMLDTLLFAGVPTLDGAGPFTFFFANAADAAGVRLTAFNYPVAPATDSLSLERLSVFVNRNFLTSDATVEIVKNGATPTGMSILVPAGATGPFEAIGEITVPGANQTLDLRLSSTGTEDRAEIDLSAALTVKIQPF